jgi:hypothetical protein
MRSGTAADRKALSRNAELLRRSLRFLTTSVFEILAAEGVVRSYECSRA